MKPKTFMLIAGEASGDTLAAELVGALRTKVLEIESLPSDDAQPLRTALAPRFFGAGGARMAATGVELAFDLTLHSVLGISEVLKNLRQFRKLLRQAIRLALERQPDVIIGVDYGGFNLRFARAIKRYVRRNHSEFTPWNPRLVQFVSPQVWASRPGRARVLEDTHDLLLSIFPFEKEWYAARAPKLRVEFVGHPMVGRFQNAERGTRNAEPHADPSSILHPPSSPRILLLPGSRWSEVRRHWPVVTGAFEILRRELPGLRAKLILPDDELVRSARTLGVPPGVDILTGEVPTALADGDLAVTKSGTITLECAMFGVPAVVFYKTSWLNYAVAKPLMKVKYLAMPNLLANEEVFPELIQGAATAANIAGAALELLRNDARRRAVKAKLARIVATLGAPGAPQRAAEAIVSLLP